jgi:hypothetical protein
VYWPSFRDQDLSSDRGTQYDSDRASFNHWQSEAASALINFRVFLMKDLASIFELSTDCLPHNERIAYWREQYGHVLLRVDLEPARDVAFRACMKSLSLSGLQIFEASSSPATISRSGDYLADGNDDAVLVMNRMGIAAVSSGSREQILREHEAILVMGNEPGSYYRPNPGQSLTVRVPRPMLRSIVADPDDSFMRVIPRNRSRAALPLRRLAAQDWWIFGFGAIEALRTSYSGFARAHARR